MDSAPGSQASLSDKSNQRINDIMKEEQNNFAYEDLDRGSNKSFSSDSGKKVQTSKMMLNMEKLVQNPGRASQGDESSGVKNRTKNNIFAGKMRKRTSE